MGEELLKDGNNWAFSKNIFALEMAAAQVITFNKKTNSEGSLYCIHHVLAQNSHDQL